jgi:orotidine 5'-phosphate decarboxylase subfamily 2
MVIDKYNKRADKVNSLLCVGLDSDFAKIPERFKQTENPQFEFNKWIIDETAEFAAAFKPNAAFYEARGAQGMKELKLTMEYIAQNCSDVFTIYDAKRGDIGNTNNGYIASIFDWLGFDSITLHPYFGSESLKPFFERTDKASIILCRSSNPGAGELQDLKVDGRPLWQMVAEKTAKDWNKNNNCMLMIGATYTEEMRIARSIINDMTLLVPGIGAQGGDVEATVKAGLNLEKKGIIVNSSRGIIFAENPGEEAKKLRDEINKYR